MGTPCLRVFSVYKIPLHHANVKDDPRLAGKVALVTGTAGGIGRATAQILAREGAAVVGCDLDPGGSAETVRLVREAGGEMTAMAPVDLSTEDGANAWVAEAARAYGGVDILVNNASAIRFGPIAELSWDDWAFTIRNELHIVFLVTRAVWPHLMARDWIDGAPARS